LNSKSFQFFFAILQAQLITKEDSIGSLAKEALVMCHEPNIHNHNITRQYVQQSIV